MKIEGGSADRRGNLEEKIARLALLMKEINGIASDRMSGWDIEKIPSGKAEEVKQTATEALFEIYNQRPSLVSFSAMIEQIAMASFEGSGEGYNADYGESAGEYVSKPKFWLLLAEGILNARKEKTAP